MNHCRGLFKVLLWQSLAAWIINVSTSKAFLHLMFVHFYSSLMLVVQVIALYCSGVHVLTTDGIFKNTNMYGVYINGLVCFRLHWLVMSGTLQYVLFILSGVIYSRDAEVTSKHNCELLLQSQHYHFGLCSSLTTVTLCLFWYLKAGGLGSFSPEGVRHAFLWWN